MGRGTLHVQCPGKQRCFFFFFFRSHSFVSFLSTSSRTRLTMTDRAESSALPEKTLRNRKTTVEDADDDSVDTSSSKQDSPSSASQASKDDKKKALAASTRPRQLQQVQKTSQLRSLIISFVIASLGVLFKSAYDKFFFPSREIAIDQTVGVQGNCHKTACRCWS